MKLLIIEVRAECCGLKGKRFVRKIGESPQFSECTCPDGKLLKPELTRVSKSNACSASLELTLES